MNLIGFDSAWADRERKPGAICAIRLEDGVSTCFDPPQSAGFAAAADFILERHRPGDLTLVAIDQPTIVPNDGGARPVERVVASLISFSGGGIQPAYRGKAALFGDDAPIWRFLARLDFTYDPEAACLATEGGFVMEAYPALALLALDPAFTAGPKCGPRYNPSRPTFRLADWAAVCRAVADDARLLGLVDAARWCDGLEPRQKPSKILQDHLDATVCLIVAARWRQARDSCTMIGDLTNGYIAAIVSSRTRAHLSRAAATCGVPIK